MYWKLQGNLYVQYTELFATKQALKWGLWLSYQSHHVSVKFQWTLNRHSVGLLLYQKKGFKSRWNYYSFPIYFFIYDISQLLSALDSTSCLTLKTLRNLFKFFKVLIWGFQGIDLRFSRFSRNVVGYCP